MVYISFYNYKNESTLLNTSQTLSIVMIYASTYQNKKLSIVTEIMYIKYLSGDFSLSILKIYKL